MQTQFETPAASVLMLSTDALVCQTRMSTVSPSFSFTVQLSAQAAELGKRGLGIAILPTFGSR